MVEVTPGLKSSSSSAFSIDAIISKDSGPIVSSPVPQHRASHRPLSLPRPGGTPPDHHLPRLPPHHHHYHLSPGATGDGSSSGHSTPDHSPPPTAYPAAMDVLTGGASRHGGGVFAAHSLASSLPPHHPHFPSPGLPSHAHSHHHLLTSAAAAAAASDSISLFSGGKPMYSSLHGAGGGMPGGLEGAAHTAGLFGQSLGAFPGSMDASGLSTLHALSASKGLHGAGALHGLTAGAMPLPGVHRQFPLYPWLSRPGAYFPRYTGSEPSFLLPFRKPKRIRTAFSPSQLLRLEHAFEKNHYVVGQERKDLAINLSLTETQVKVWFQNRRTKHKRIKTEEEQEQRGTGKPDSKEDDDE